MLACVRQAELGPFLPLHVRGGTRTASGSHLMQLLGIGLRHDLNGRILCLTRNKRKSSDSLSLRTVHTRLSRWKGFEPRFGDEITTFDTVHNVDWLAIYITPNEAR